MIEMFNVSGKSRSYELDSRSGLNGSRCNGSYSCLMDESRSTFFVWLGAQITIEQFTKTSYLSLTNFAEAQGATKVVLVQARDHHQKGNSLFSLKIFVGIVNFQKLFKVLDAQRLNKKALQGLVVDDKIEEAFEAFAFYVIQLA
jgi:hypothetical protein